MARIGKVDNSSLSDPVFSPLKPDGENRITISGLLPTGETFTVEHGQVQIESASSFGTGFSTRTFTPADPTATEQVIEALNLRFSDRDKEAQVGLDKDGFLAIVPHPDLRPSTVPGVTRAPALPEEAPGVLSSVVAAIGNRAKEAIKGKRLPPESKLKWNDQGEVNIHHDVLPLPDTRMFGVEDGVIFIESNPDAAPVDPTDPTATMEGRAFHQADPDDQEKVLTYLKGKYEKQFGPMALTYRGRIVVIEETPDVKADMEAVRDASMDELRASAREKMSWSERRKAGKEETRKQAEEHAQRLEYVVEFVNTHDLTALVIQERNRGESDEVIANTIYAQFPDEPEISNVINWSFTEADKRGKTIKSKKRWAKVPGAKEFAWDRTADEKELFSRVRKMIDNGEDRAQVERDLAATLGTKPGEREFIDYIIDRAQDEQFQKDHARQFVFVHSLDQRVLELRKADPAIKPDEILADPQIQAALKPGEKCKAEIKEIIEAAMERADSVAKYVDMRAKFDKKVQKLDRDINTRVPGTKEFAWDTTLRSKDVVSLIRRRTEEGVSRADIETEIKALLKGEKDLNNLTEYAFEKAKDAKFNKHAASLFAFVNDLDKEVIRLQNTTTPTNRLAIEAALISKIKTIGITKRSGDEIKEIIAAAFDRAENGEKWKERGEKVDRFVTSKKRKLKLILPFTQEREWMQWVKDNDVVRYIRKRREDGEDDATVRNELDHMYSGRKDLDKILDFAFDRADDAGTNRKMAAEFVKTNGLVAEVQTLRTAGRSEAEIRTALRTKHANPDMSDAELNDIISLAIEKVESSERWGERWKMTKTVLKGIGTGLKYTGMAVGAAAIVGGGTLGVAAWGAAKVLGFAGRGVSKVATTVRPYVAPVAVGGARIVGRVAKAALWDIPVRAPARIVYTTFKRWRDGVKLGANILPKPDVKKGKGFFGKVGAFFRNNSLGGLYQAGRAAAVAGALLVSPFYGFGEGVVQAGAKDVIGLQTGVSEPMDQIFAKYSKAGGAPAAASEPAPAEHAEPHAPAPH